MKKKTMRVILPALLAVLMLCFTGCSSQSTGSTVTQSAEEDSLTWVYVLEDLDWGFEEDENGNGYYSTQGCFGHQLLRTYTVYEESGEHVELLVMDLDTGSVKTIECETGEDSYIYNAAIIPEGDSTEFVLLESYYDEETHYSVRILDENGQTRDVFSLDDLMSRLEEQNGYAYVSDLIVGTDGYIYLGCDSAVFVTDMEGNQIAEIAVPNWLNSMGLSEDGRVIATYYDNGYQLAYVNPDTKAFETIDFGVTNFSSNTVSVLADGSVVYGDSSGLYMYRYDASSGETETLFDWISLDIVGYNVDAVYYIDEDNLLVEIYDYTSNFYSENMSLVTRKESSEVSEKTTLTLALFSSDSYTQEYVVAFNKANDQYRIEIKTYLDYTLITDYNDYQTYYDDAVTRMQNDLVSGDGADIIMTGYGVNTNTLISSGLLEDLVPYLDERGYTRDQFVTQVYDAYLRDGKLYELPSEFELQTVYALSELVGDSSGWTLEEAAEVIANLPEGMEWFMGETCDQMLNTLLTYGYTGFINEEDHTCSFDSEEFKALLELAAAFPEESNETWEESEPTKIQNGTLAAEEVYIYDLDELQLYRAHFEGKKYTAIGYPGVGGNGTIISGTGSTYAICSKSEYKDAAADFIVSTLTEDTTWGGYAFSILQSELDAYFEEETTVEYELDENGDPYLDEDGNPIVIGGSSGIGYQDGWEYWYEPCTEEDVEEFYELLNGAVTVANSGNSEILAIIEEEAGSFFSGQKSVDDVAEIIQNRVSLYLSENS
ncbi:MAG: extracellular solute-binding protein [Lachnospiraceae bacterium]|nr:extracellular solute-binding protein [Lachnospiraceae bacterium]